MELRPTTPTVERFVRFVVAGGLLLVLGLWLTALFADFSRFWLLGVALTLLGVAGLGAGIWSEIEV